MRRINVFLFSALGAISLGPALAQSPSAYDCLIEPHSVVEVSTREEGVMEEIAVGRGDVVKKGQVLAVLESGVEKIAVELAQARAEMDSQVNAKQAALRYLRAQHKRIDDLYKKKAIPFHEKDKALTDQILAEAELREAKENFRLAQIEKLRAEEILKRRTIRSPVDGVVVQLMLEPGESVEERPIVVVAEVDPLNVEIILSDKEYGSIKVGSKAEVQPLLPGAQPQTAEVTVVDRVIDAASNTFGVRLEMPNPDNAVPGGVRCEIRFLTNSNLGSE